MKLIDFFTGRSAPLIGKATTELQEMIVDSRKMYVAATGKLLDNEILDFDLSEADDAINEREQSIRRMVLEHITIDPQHEMVFGLVLLSVVQDAERLGDIAKTIAEVAALADRQRFGPEVDELREIHQQVLAMYDDTAKGFLEGSVEMTTRVMESNRTHKPRREEYIRKIAQDGTVGENMAVVLSLGARLIGRTASHLSNIASGVAAPFDQLRNELDE